MATNAKAFAEVGLGELLELETSVLQDSVSNRQYGGLRAQIQDPGVLTSYDFYFPVNGAIFEALEDMHRQGRLHRP